MRIFFLKVFSTTELNLRTLILLSRPLLLVPIPLDHFYQNYVSEKYGKRSSVKIQDSKIKTSIRFDFEFDEFFGERITSALVSVKSSANTKHHLSLTTFYENAREVKSVNTVKTSLLI